MKKIYILLLLGIPVLESYCQLGPVIWEEQFSDLDQSSWNVITGDGCDEGNCGWGSQELEYFKSENVFIEEIEGENGNFALVLEARNETIGSSSFTSGKITSASKLAVKYGMIEMRIKTPLVETGLKPAAWLLGTNDRAVGWPSCGEADLMEMGQKAAERSRQGFPGASANQYVGANLLWYSEESCDEENPACVSSIAFDTYYNNPYVAEETLSERFLLYRMYWDDKSIRFTLVDRDIEYDLYASPFPIGSNEAAFNKPFYFILNLAVGGNFTDAADPEDVTAPFPAQLLVDYIRVRQWNGKGEVFTTGDLMANAGADQIVDEGSAVILNGAGSYGDIDSYSWSINGEEVASGVNPGVNLPPGSYVVTLTVSNSDGRSSSDKINVIVGSNALGEIIWEDEFTELNSDIWTPAIGDGCDEGLCGWGNQELEYYQSENVYIEEIPGEAGNYALVLEARQENAGSSEFTSGKVTTESKLAIKYGLVEVRMKVPDLDAGLWPAAWLLGTNHRSVGWPKCGEIDMMEMGQSAATRADEGYAGVSPNRFVGANLLWYSSGACSAENQSCAASIAYDTYYTTPYVSSTAMNDRFIIYRLYWDEKSIRFTAEDNGTEYDLYTNPFPIGANEAAFQQPYYFLLNLAVGGAFTGIFSADGISAPMPAKMYIDYLRVRKYNGKGEVSYPGGNVLANAGSDIIITDEDKNGSEQVSLDATASYGNIETYEWFEGKAQIAKGQTASVDLLSGVHYITLRVTDSQGNTSEDEIRIEVSKIVWEDNFDSFDTGFWTPDIGDGCDQGICGWGNQELQYYSENNITIEEIEGEPGNNALVIEAKSESMGTKSFTSGKITTSDKVNLRYGKYEVRMKSPRVDAGLWPAAWLLGTSSAEIGWPAGGEIDMMEMGHKSSERTRQGFPGISANNYVGANLIWYDDEACSPENLSCAASIAYDTWYNTPYVSASPLSNRFQVYRLYWDDKSIRFTVEDIGTEYDLYTGPFPVSGATAAFREPFFFLLNLAVGGNFTDAATNAQVTAPLPAKMYIDYVRVSSYNGKGEVFYADGIIANAGPDAIIIDKNADGTEKVILDGSGSSDYNGSLLSYTWTLEGSEIASGVIPTIELPRGTHRITLSVRDNDGNTASDEVVVIITTGGLGPVADAGPDLTFNDEDGDDLVAVTLDGSLSAPAGTPIVSYSWQESGSEIGSGVSFTTDFSTGIHEITLVVTDEEGLTGTDKVSIIIIDPDNIAPLADAGEDINVDDLDGDDLVFVELNGSGSSDSDGFIEVYTWSEGGQVLGNTMLANVEFSTGKHNITLTVRDDDGISSDDQLIITVTDPDNIPPMADAGPDMKIIDSDRSGSQLLTLDASASSDSDGTIENYVWEEGGFEIASGISPAVELTTGEHLITLTVTDDDGISAADELLVKVHQQPIAVAGEDIFVLDEDGNGSEDVTLDASLSTDPFGSLLTYSWKENDSEIASGVTSVVNFILGTHLLTLEVTDDDAVSATDELIVIVARPDNVPPLAVAGEDVNVIDTDGDGKETIILDGAASSDDDGTVYSYSWIENDIQIASGSISELDFSIGEHTVILIVTDNEGASDADTLKIIVNPACIFEACTGDFKAIISSADASNTTITFIPLKANIGETLCLLYYGSSGTFPGYGVNPYQAVKMNGLTQGQQISFYYTYSIPTGQNSTVACQESFTVGACDLGPNEAPVANAGEDQFIIDEDENGNETITLDATGSYDPDGSIIHYSWKEGSTQLATGESATLNLSTGIHLINLTVADDLGATDSDQLRIEIGDPDGTNLQSLSPEIEVYPNPVGAILYVKSNKGSIERLQLYTSLGEKVMDTSWSDKLDVEQLPSGLYILFVSAEGATIPQKVIKQ